MTTVDPTAALEAETVSHLATELGSGYTVRRGWPEFGKSSARSFDLSEPLVSVTTGDPDEEERAPESQGSVDNGDGTSTTTYAFGRGAVTIQVDLWAPYKVQRDQGAVLVRNALNNRLPLVAGLSLELTDYYERRATVEWDGSKKEDDSDATARGVWRQTWTGTAEYELAMQTLEPTTTKHVVELELDDGAVDDEVEVTP